MFLEPKSCTALNRDCLPVSIPPPHDAQVDEFLPQVLFDALQSSFSVGGRCIDQPYVKELARFAARCRCAFPANRSLSFCSLRATRDPARPPCVVLPMCPHASNCHQSIGGVLWQPCDEGGMPVPPAVVVPPPLNHHDHVPEAP